MESLANSRSILYQTLKKITQCKCGSLCGLKFVHIQISSPITLLVMIFHSSCTTENTSRNTSDAAIRVAEAIRQASDTRDNEKLARISRIRSRIKDLEARGLLKRQEFYAPTTADFERKLSCDSRNSADLSKVKGKA